MNREIEIKLKLGQHCMKFFLNWLSEHAKFIAELCIKDHYFYNISSTMPNVDHRDVLKFFRIRITNKGSFFCFKNRNIDGAGKTVNVEELETEVEDGTIALQILKKANLGNELIIEKTRKVFLVDQTFEVAVDFVNKMGTFIEIELLKHNNDVEVGMKKIYAFLKKVGIKEFIKFDRGYLCMFLNPDRDFGIEKKF